MIRVVIAEDQRMLRCALGSLLDLEEDIEVVGQAENGEEALRIIYSFKPDVCLLDIEMPIKSGLDVAEELKQLDSSCKVIILTTFARPGYFERALKANVHGYFLKESSSDELADSIRHIMKGKREFAPELVFGSVTETNPLTAREQDVLRQVAAGKTANEISASLYLSSGTIRNYISEIINKLGAKNRIEAISMAQQKGWI
ncbi:response regulator transcription factor [Rummeliibacillus sp. G93]|uniref:response regulator transcription factor n=1 Tax=Rummeliibacillus TaxID=648802 RepID=UPI00116E2EB7|nr:MULTISPECIES: response regulator transcription factor [Rummeliibacillus]MBB5169583.1 DNA-binding NarL/FixJ family response regulator [Rummeliibacillus stabekisii]UQW98662.1 response regulator transcription factor [Rummeliibacillus sp. G93]GEL03840.1 DNA-binding response regulator [Rummeliibacillus stabekisii]